MNAKLFRQITLAVMMTTVLSNCSSLDRVLPDNTQKYRKAETMPPLEIPPDLSTSRIKDDIGHTQNTSVSYTEFEETSTNPLAAKYNIVPDSKPALSGEDKARHLVVPGERSVSWQRIQDFWASKKITIRRIDERLGLMDTQPDADGYAYRLRLEKGDTSRTAEVYLGAKNDSKRNEQKDEAMLRQLAEYLGVLYAQDKAAFNAVQPAANVQQSARAVLVDEGAGKQALLVKQNYPIVWDRVGRVLDSKGFSVEDRDRVQGFYFVRYIDPFKEQKEKDESFLDSLAFWQDDVDVAPDEFYYIKLISDASNTRIVILDAEGVRSTEDTAKRLLDLIQEQLTL